ncbi:MAG TPA: DUF4912 domain-containing protein [Anaeromyxobacter sp.]
MPDFKKMTVESLRELARKVLGPGHSKKTKSELIAALQAAQGKAAPPPARESGARARGAGGRTEAPPTKAAKPAPRAAAKGPVRKAGEAARNGAKAVARAGKAAAVGAAEGMKAAVKTTRARKSGKAASALAAVAGAAAGAAAGVAAARGTTKVRRAAGEGPDPEGYFVARVRGEDAVRDAPHPMTETSGDSWADAEETTGAPIYDEQLGDLPWGYGDDAFVALPRDPRTVFLYWDYSHQTLARGFDGLDHPRTQLWIFARAGAGWDRVRVTEFALESRGFYVHDLEPGRVYRAEIHLVDHAGREKLLASPSNEVALPPVGPSPIVDDRFIRIPWDLPLGRLLGPGHPGSAFSEEARAMLARLSDWSRFSGPTWGGSAGGMGGRPSSPGSAPSSPSSPWGGGSGR